VALVGRSKRKYKKMIRERKKHRTANVHRHPNRSEKNRKAATIGVYRGGTWSKTRFGFKIEETVKSTFGLTDMAEQNV